MQLACGLLLFVKKIQKERLRIRYDSAIKVKQLTPRKLYKAQRKSLPAPHYRRYSRKTKKTARNPSPSSNITD
jgi:hypothetical protein